VEECVSTNKIFTTACDDTTAKNPSIPTRKKNGSIMQTVIDRTCAWILKRKTTTKWVHLHPSRILYRLDHLSDIRHWVSPGLLDMPKLCVDGKRERRLLSLHIRGSNAQCSDMAHTHTILYWSFHWLSVRILFHSSKITGVRDLELCFLVPKGAPRHHKVKFNIFFGKFFLKFSLVQFNI
jgi:hypothetical protein